MDFTFGIITAGGKEDQIDKIIDSIEMQNIPHYDIIIIGDCKLARKNTVVYPFDEKSKHMWITRKKNIITYYALHENIVFLHDYITFDPGWYEGFVKFGNDFKIASNITLDKFEERWVDWSLWWEDVRFVKGCEQRRTFLLPYDVQDLSRYMYIAGSYWVAKKHVMQEFPLDERLGWGEGEDVEWSKVVRRTYNFSFNANSTVHFLKQKSNPFFHATDDVVQKCRDSLK